jgi:hypothetical protein
MYMNLVKNYWIKPDLSVEGADEKERNDKVDEVGVQHEGFVIPVL